METKNELIIMFLHQSHFLALDKLNDLNYMIAKSLFAKARQFVKLAIDYNVMYGWIFNVYFLFDGADVAKNTLCM